MAAVDSRRCSSLMKMPLFAVLILFNLVYICSSDEQLVILHSPDYITFHENTNLRASEIPDVLSSILGFTTLHDDKWRGVDSGNPFKRPQGIVLVEIEGLKDSQLKLPGLRFPLETDVESGWPFQLIADRTYIRFAEEKPVLMSLANDDSLYTLRSEYPNLLNSLAVKPSELKSKVLGPDSVVYGMNLEALNISVNSDIKFLMDAQILFDMAKIVESKADILNNGIPDLFWFRFNGVQELLAVYSYDSEQVREAVKILNFALERLEKSFIHVYDSNVLIAVLAVDYQTGNSIRAGRSLLAVSSSTAKPPSPNEFKISTPYDETYSAIFNIAFFIMIAFWLAIFAVSLGIWHMDPGRDSIIYRMTSQRMKKDQ